MDSVWKHHPDIRAAEEIAENYYDFETFKHARRVANYIKENPYIPREYHLECICLAIMHDLLEDTEYVNNPMFETEFGRMNRHFFDKALNLITRKKDETYKDYIKRMKYPTDDELMVFPRYIYECVWWVKLADIKDHLIQKDTLPDSLRDRYMWALSYLL